MCLLKQPEMYGIPWRKPYDQKTSIQIYFRFQDFTSDSSLCDRRNDRYYELQKDRKRCRVDSGGFVRTCGKISRGLSLEESPGQTGDVSGNPL